MEAEKKEGKTEILKHSPYVTSNQEKLSNVNRSRNRDLSRLT